MGPDAWAETLSSTSVKQTNIFQQRLDKWMLTWRFVYHRVLIVSDRRASRFYPMPLVSMNIRGAVVPHFLRQYSLTLLFSPSSFTHAWAFSPAPFSSRLVSSPLRPILRWKKTGTLYGIQGTKQNNCAFGVAALRPLKIIGFNIVIVKEKNCYIPIDCPAIWLLN